MKTLGLLQRTPTPSYAGKRLFIHTPKATKGADSLEGKFVTQRNADGSLLFARVEKQDGLLLTLKLAVPDGDGVLMLTQCTAQAESVKCSLLRGEPVVKEAVLKPGNMVAPFDEDSIKAATIVKADDVVLDYRDLHIEGFASTFKGTTPRDRDGDTISDSAFNETIADFMQNPVLLFDHRNSVDNIVGSFKKLGVTAKGLGVRAQISNAPELRKIRFLIAEGHLKAFSIGGLFMFGGPDGRLIEKVILFEISLVAIPANPDALFAVRSLNAEDVVKATAHFKAHQPGAMRKLLGSAVI